MNICFYTSAAPSVTDLLNINYLITQRPAHNYSFLRVAANDTPPPTLKDRVKKIYGRLRADDGRFDFERDVKLMHTGLKHHVQPLDHKQFNSAIADRVNDAASVNFLEQMKPDIIIQAGAGILKKETFGQARIATINLHHGIAPEIRGIESTFWCMLYGIRELIGVTCHLIDETLDTGAIITQQRLVSTRNDLIGVQTENYLQGRDVLVNAIDILQKGGLTIKSDGEVRSYYFGNVNPFFYYALKKRNFAPQMKISEKTYKMKQKKVLVS
jgi:folate-dependent phosphoribosylglycinamide formyltransferase PurN